MPEVKARPRTEVRDVWQNRAYAPVPPWVTACTVIDARLERYLVRGADKQRVEPGDWLIRDLDGAPAWSTDEDFRRQYEVVG